MTDSEPRSPDTEPTAPPAPADPPEVPVEDPAGQPILASAPGVGTRIGNLNVTALSPLGWAVVSAGILGTLLIATSYLAGWLTGTLESFGVSETDSLRLDEVTRPGLAWMYRLATLALIGCALALVFAPRSAWSLVRLTGFAAAGLSLLSAVIATIVIGTILVQGREYFGDADAVGYGWGLYAGYLGILAVTGFVGLFERVTRR